MSKTFSQMSQVELDEVAKSSRRELARSSLPQVEQTVETLLSAYYLSALSQQGCERLIAQFVYRDRLREDLE